MTSPSKTVLLGAAALATSGLLALASLPDAADAAITVVGGGAAQSCYVGAEYGRDPGEYIVYCTAALNDVLSTHDRAATYVNRGVMKLSLNMSDDALADFNAGLAIDPGLGEGYIDRGATLIEKKQFADAIHDIDKGISLGAKKPNIAYYDRAIADEAMGDIKGAYNDYQQALALAPGFTAASDELKRFKVVRKTEGS